MLEGHISKAFDGQLATLHIRVLEMGGLVLSQVQEAAKAYTEWDEEAARRVNEREPEVNQYKRSTDNEQASLIARRAPVAGDLRAVIAMSRIVAELERAGDEAKKIARIVLSAAPRPGSATSRDVRHLGILAVSLFRLALDAVDTFDPQLATEVIARDPDLDAEYSAGLRRLLTRAMEDARNVEVALEAAFVLKSLERIGDHGRNMARHVLLVLGRPTANADPKSGSGPTSDTDKSGTRTG
jgi:phosphate transport system protein